MATETRPSRFLFFSPRRVYRKPLLTLALLLGAAAMISGFTLWPRSPLDLGSRADFSAAELMRHWGAGEVVVLVRHGERCDRSSNACLGPEEGITVHGSEASAQLGAALTEFGLQHTDVLNSPAKRTEQTAAYMFDRASEPQEWLAECRKDMGVDIAAHKAPGRNLVLVTHSGCINDLEAQEGFPHADEPGYTSALFATLAADGDLRIVGRVNVEDWPEVMAAN